MPYMKKKRQIGRLPISLMFGSCKWLNQYFPGWVGGVVGGIKNKTNSVQLQLPTGTELGKKNDIYMT